MVGLRIQLRAAKLVALCIFAPLATWALNLEELVDAALAHHPDLEFSKASLEAGRIQESSLPWWSAPELRLGYGRDANVSDAFRSTTYPDHDYDAAFRIFPKNPWERSAKRREIRSMNRLLELSLLEGTQQIGGIVKQLYWEVVYLKAALVFKMDLLEILQEEESRQQALLESGQITLGRSLSAKMNRLDLAIEVDQLKRKLEGVSAELGVICAVEPVQIKYEQFEDLSADYFDLPYSGWLAEALELRPDLQRYRLQTENANAKFDTIKAGRIPWIKHVQASYRVRNQYGESDSAGVEFAINLPFFASDGGEKRIAKNRLETRYRQSSQARKVVELEVKALIEEFRSFERQWQMQGQQLITMQKELLDAIHQMESQGNNSGDSYWDTRTSLLQLELKELEMTREFNALLLKAEGVLGAAI